MNEQNPTAGTLAAAIITGLDGVAKEYGADIAAVIGEQPNDPNVVTLETPLRRGDQTLTAVTLRKPRTGELRGVQLASLGMMDVDALRTVLPRITSPALTPQDVNNLELPDIMALATKVAGFFMTKAERATQPE